MIKEFKDKVEVLAQKREEREGKLKGEKKGDNQRTRSGNRIFKQWASWKERTKIIRQKKP